MIEGRGDAPDFCGGMIIEQMVLDDVWGVFGECRGAVGNGARYELSSGARSCCRRAWMATGIHWHGSFR